MTSEHSTKSRLLIVEDDYVVATDLSMSLGELGYEVTAVVDSGEDALQTLKQQPVDVILLDINLAGKLDGISTATKIQQEFELPYIFLTANQDMETLKKAQQTLPKGYLVKPFNMLTLRSTIEMALETTEKREEESQKAIFNPEYIFLKSRKRLEKVRYEQVLFIEADDIYANLYTEAKTHFVGHSLRYIQENFPTDRFFRVHRSYMVNLEKIDAIEDKTLIIGEHQVPVGKTYREKLLQKIAVL